MAKKLTSNKAKEILHDKSVHGHPLTDKQRKFFGAIAGGAPMKVEQGGWLEKYNGGGMQEYQENYNDNTTSYPPGFVGMGNDTTGRNYSPAWGGQFQMGGSMPGAVGFTYARTAGAAPDNGPYAKKTKASAQDGLTFLEPNSSKLPVNNHRSELAISIGGEDGEPALLIPSFKYGQPILGPSDSPYAEFRRTGDYLGGPFKTWQEADEWDQNVRHPYVEKGQSIPTPLRRWGKDFENGGSMTYYQHGLDWKPKSISKNGDDIPKNQNAEFVLPNPRDLQRQMMNASESTAPTSRALTTGMSKENMAASSQAMGKSRATEERLKQQRIKERKAAKSFDKGEINTFTFPNGQTKTKDQMDWREKAYISGKSLEGKGRFNENDEAWYDTINPLNWITETAGALGTAPYEAKQSNSNLPYLTSIGQGLFLGATGVDPLGSAMKLPGKVAQSMESGLLSNTYKLNPWAFKPNPEAYYRMLGKEGTVDAFESGILRAKQNNNIISFDPDKGFDLTSNQGPLYDRPYFSKGTPLDRDWKSPLSKKKGSIYPGPDMVEVTNSSKFHPTYDLVASPNQTLSSFDPDTKFYTQDWLRGYKEVPKQEEGGIIEDDRGQWAHPGKITKINSNQITMKGVDYPVLGISDAGDKQMMYPDQDYTFKGKNVTEYPMAQKGKTLPPIYTQDPRKVQAYNDSLNLYNDYNRLKNILDKQYSSSDYIKKEENFPRNPDGSICYNCIKKEAERKKQVGNFVDNLYGKVQQLANPNINPIGYINYLKDNLFFDESQGKIYNYSNVKPVQPIIYRSKQSKDKSSQWKPLTPEIAKGRFSGNIDNMVYRETGDPDNPYNITGIPPKPKLEPTLKKKVSNITPISMTDSFTPGVTSIQHPEIKLQNLPQGEYRTSYWDPEIKDWNERAFMSQQESDQFANEMSQRGYGAPYGNVTQTRKINKKSTGGWLEKYN
jgi:hypothetical protein